MIDLEYRTEIQRIPESEGGGYLVRVPDLPGCMADGETVEEALKELRDAIKQWKVRAKAMGREIPKPNYEELRRA